MASQESTPIPSDTASALVIEPVRTLRFTTDEGTWISLDVSPDGQQIAFDLLGDLYTIPITGGQATPLTQGMEFDATPRWSPDGSTIAFISDRDGGDNLWVISPDGSGLRKLTKEVDSALGSPEWMPDGEYIVTRRYGPYPSAENYLTNVPLWMYHVNGGSGSAGLSAECVTEVDQFGRGVLSGRRHALHVFARRRIRGRDAGGLSGPGVRPGDR